MMKGCGPYEAERYKLLLSMFHGDWKALFRRLGFSKQPLLSTTLHAPQNTSHEDVGNLHHRLRRL